MGHHKEKAIADQDKRRHKRASRGTGKNSFRGFVSYQLKNVDKADYARFELTEDMAGELLPHLLSDGYRISFSADKRNGCFMAAISTKDTDSPNEGLVLTARSGRDFFQAGLRAIYMHLVIFDEVWPDPSEEMDYSDEWEVDAPD